MVIIPIGDIMVVITRDITATADTIQTITVVITGILRGIIIIIITTIAIIIIALQETVILEQTGER